MPAIRKLLSNYLPNIFDMGGSSNENDVLQFSTYGETRPASLYPTSIVSVERRSKGISTILTGDENLRADAEGIPFRWSVDVSAVSTAVSLSVIALNYFIKGTRSFGLNMGYEPLSQCSKLLSKGCSVRLDWIRSKSATLIDVDSQLTKRRPGGIP